jgi:hypothetical protein
MTLSRTTDFLRAELAALDRLIAESTGDDDLALIGFEARRDDVANELASAESRDRRIGRAALTFNGDPVVGTRGIDADFAGEALERFQKLVAKKAAVRAGATLGTRGPIPHAEQSRLLVTGTALGSFGFVLEESAPSLIAPSLLAEALDDSVRLLEAAKDDDAFGDLVAENDPEVVSALAKFVELLSTSGATVSVRTSRATAIMKQREEVLAAAGRASTVRDEADLPIDGVLEGLLPTGRRFEFRRADTNELIVGKLASDVADVDALKRYLDTRCVAHVRVITFQRPGREHRRFELRNVVAERT